jgi:hypothetical protein
MGQTSGKEIPERGPSSAACIRTGLVCKDPGYMQYSQNNSKNIQDLLKWVREEFDPHQYSGKITNRKALANEIKKKCNDKLDEEWVKFGNYPKKSEQTYRLCMFATMVHDAKELLKSRK